MPFTFGLEVVWLSVIGGASTVQAADRQSVQVVVTVATELTMLSGHILESLAIALEKEHCAAGVIDDKTDAREERARLTLLHRKLTRLQLATGSLAADVARYATDPDSRPSSVLGRSIETLADSTISMLGSVKDDPRLSRMWPLLRRFPLLDILKYKRAYLKNLATAGSPQSKDDIAALTKLASQLRVELTQLDIVRNHLFTYINRLKPVSAGCTPTA